MGQYKSRWDIGSGSYTEYRYRDPKDINQPWVEGPWSTETHKKMNGFYSKYGITSEELAIEEGVSSTALNMRHMKFGTVWQRKAKPTELERLFHKTNVELAHELGVHPVTIMARFKRYGTPYHIRYHMVKNNAGESVRCDGKCNKKACVNGKIEHPLRNKTMNYTKILFPECSDLREKRMDAVYEYTIMFDKYVKKIGGIEWHSVVKNKEGGYDLYVKQIHQEDLHWTELSKYANSKFWLHENHPDYPHEARKGL